MRAAIYCRVSTEEQGRPGHVSLPNQEAACRTYARQHKWTMVEPVYVDEQSGLDPSREKYQQLLEDARAGKFDTVLAYHPYRFGRDAGEAISRCNELTRLNVVVQTCTVDITEPVIRDIFFVLGQQQSRDTSRQTRDNMQRLAEAGRWVSRPPLGYSLLKTRGLGGGVLVPNDSAPLVRRLFELYANGSSIRELQREAEKLGLRCGGRIVDRRRIDQILHNVAYVGRVQWGRQSHSKITGRRRLPPAEWIVADGQHEAIIDQETWDAVQRRLEFNREHRTGPKRTDYLLTSFIRCCRCGGRMHGQTTRRKSGTTYQMYRCQNGTEFGTCEQKYVSGPAVERLVKEQLADVLPRMDETMLDGAKALVIKAAAVEMAKERREVAKLQAQRERAVRRIKALTEQRLDEKLPAEIYSEMVAEAKENLERIDRDLDLMADAGNVDGAVRAVKAIWRLMERVPWPPAPDDQRGWRKVVENSVDVVEVCSKDDVKVRLNASARASAIAGVRTARTGW